MKSFVIAAVTVLALSSNVYAQDTASGTMTVTGTLVSSISLTIESGAGTFSGGGTGAATSALGNISKYGTMPAGMVQSITDTQSWLWGGLSVRVATANTPSATYTLSALLGSALPTGIAWALGADYLSDVTPNVLASAGTYGATTAYLWVVIIDDTASNGSSMDNTINFSAVAN